MKIVFLSLLITLVLVPNAILSAPVPLQTASDVQVSSSTAPTKIKRGAISKASVVLDIPAGLHIQSNRPLDKFLVATKLEIAPPQGLKVSPVSYPRAVTRKLKFSKGAVAVFEGRAVLRFNITVPASYKGGSTEIKGNVRFQACNDESCFPPVTREVKMWLEIE
jgi:thiol:disulfide interchange protein DsbD